MRRFVLLLLLSTAPAMADDPPARVKVELSPKDGAWVGQRVTLAITLDTPDFFAGVPSFAIPTIPGTVVLPPAGSPVLGSETIGDTTFTTQRHEFAIYAQRAEIVRIPAFAIRFESNAGFGKPIIRRQVTTETVSFTAKTPPGADGLGTVIAARNLKVTDAWQPEPKTAKVGDAFTRTLTVTADDVPGMVFPSFQLDGIEGLAAYPKEPAVERSHGTRRADRSSRRDDHLCLRSRGNGGRPGSHADVVRPRCQRTGDSEGTGAELHNRIRAETRSDSRFRHTRARRAFRRVGDRRRDRGRPRGLRMAGRPAPAAVCASLRELDRVRAGVFRETPPRLPLRRPAHGVCGPVAVARSVRTDVPRRVRARTDDPELTGTIAALADRVYGQPDVHSGAWSGGQLFARIALARRRLRSSTTRPGAHSLPPLNPVG